MTRALPGPQFTRRVEDFDCANCGARVVGSGYTNHCPACLWSKHVDVNPGDRASACGGLMEPVGVVLEHGLAVIVHRCLRCDATTRNKAAAADDHRLLAELSAWATTAGARGDVSRSEDDRRRRSRGRGRRR